MKAKRLIIVLGVVAVLSGCASKGLIPLNYDPTTDMDKAIIFGMLNSEHILAIMDIDLKNLDTGKTYVVERGDIWGKDPFFAIKVKPGRYIIDSMSFGINDYHGETDFTFEVPEYTAANLGTLDAFDLDQRSCGFVIRENFDEPENIFKQKYSHLNFKIIRNQIGAPNKDGQKETFMMERWDGWHMYYPINQYLKRKDSQ